MTRPINEPEKRVIWASAMGKPTNIVAAEISKPLSATAPEVNLSQVILMSALRQEKAREAETNTGGGKDTFQLGFLRNNRCTYKITNH